MGVFGEPGKCASTRLGKPHRGTDEPHTCPYAEDVNDDKESLCHCCRACEQECADDI